MSLEIFSCNHDSENRILREVTVNLLMIQYNLAAPFAVEFILYLVGNGSLDTDLCCETKAFL